MSSGIYGIRNIVNGKIYVGQTKDFKHRWREHVRELNHNIHHNKHLQNAWNKYGEENFEFFVIEKCSPTDLNGYQTFWILYYDSHDNGYNMDIGGKGIRGYKHTKEEIDKMIQIQHPKPVVQLNLDMSYIATFPSASTAGKTLGKNSSSGIKRCCEKDKYKQAYGFRWMYKEDYDSGNIDYDYYLSPNSNDSYRISKYDLSMNLVEIYENAKEAAKSVNGKPSSLISVIGKKRTYMGFVWRKTDSYTQDEYLEDKKIDYNNLKKNACIENGKVAAKHTKRISQYDFNLNLINIFPSVKEASKSVNDTSGYISQVLNPDKKRSSYKGFVWRKTDEYTQEQYEADVKFYKGYKNPTKPRKVDQCDLFGKVITTFSSMTKASKFLGISTAGISRCCNGEKESYKGFVWKYHEENKL